MKAVLWLTESKCRVLVYSSEGHVVDTNDDWNNRASAELTVKSCYPTAKISFVRHTETEKIKELNSEWNSCVHGS